VSLGVDHGRDEVTGSEDFDVDSRDNTGVFAQYTGHAGKLRVEASLRSDDNEQFGTHTTGGVGLAWPLGAGIEVIAQYGTGFKAPTFNELYYPFFGNPLLEPEQSRSTELALQRRVGVLEWRVSAFETRVKDLVGFDSNFMPANIDRARIRGVESRADLRLGGWRSSAALTLLDPVNESAGSSAGNVLPRRVRAGGHVDIERAFTDSTFGARLLAEGARFDNAANTRRVGGHTTVDLRGEYRLNADWRVQARISNLFDRDYETVAFYPQPGRAAYMTLRFSPAR
jgi:vitamin B12 transporter